MGLYLHELDSGVAPVFPNDCFVTSSYPVQYIQGIRGSLYVCKSAYTIWETRDFANESVKMEANTCKTSDI